MEHISGTGHGGCTPLITNIDGFQSATGTEHVVHLANLAGVETAEAKVRQTETRVEHVTHVRHFRGVEVVYVKARQTTAAIEHLGHVRHFMRLEARHIQVGQ